MSNGVELDGLAKSFNWMAKQLNVGETQLRESSRTLVTVLEGMFEGVIALDDEGKAVLVNPAAGRLLSFDPAEAAGRPLLEVAQKLIGNFVSSSPRVKIRDSHRIEREHKSENVIVTPDELRILR